MNGETNHIVGINIEFIPALTVNFIQIELKAASLRHLEASLIRTVTSLDFSRCSDQSLSQSGLQRRNPIICTHHHGLHQDEMCYKYHNRITTQKHTTTRLQGYDVAPICSIYNSVIKAEREETETRERQLEICLCLIFSLHSSSSENIVFIWRSPPKLFEEKYLNKSGDKKKRARAK